MSDIFREVDEDIRHEKFRRLWDRLGVWVIILAVAIVAGTAGYRGWLYWQGQQSMKAGDAYLEAVRLAQDGKAEEAEAAFAAMGSATGGYPVLAKFRLAESLAASGKADEAVAAYDALAADSSVEAVLRGLAAVRAGYIALDTADLAALKARLEPLTDENNSWRFAAREILAFAAWSAGDMDAAIAYASQITDDAAAPREIGARVSILTKVIRGSQPSIADKGETN